MKKTSSNSARTLGLFPDDDAADDLTGKYSYSKRESLESCARRYFYQYYAGLKRVPYDDERKALIRTLKTLTNRHMLAGNILHSLIETRLGRGADWADSWFVRTAAERFDRAVAYSKHPASAEDANRFVVPILSEVAYGGSDTDIVLEEARARLIASIQTFLTDPRIVAVYKAILSREHEVEAKVSGLRVAGFSVDGWIDLLGRDESGLQIVDWKMGEADSFDDSLQLFIYGWWLGQKYRVAPNRIRARKVYLTGPTVGEPVVLDDAMMRRGKARIVQDIELMKELDPFGREGNEEAFTPCAKLNVCRQCSFRGVCSAGLSMTASKPISMSLPLLQTAS